MPIRDVSDDITAFNSMPSDAAFEWFHDQPPEPQQRTSLPDWVPNVEEWIQRSIVVAARAPEAYTPDWCLSKGGSSYAMDIDVIITDPMGSDLPQGRLITAYLIYPVDSFGGHFPTLTANLQKFIDSNSHKYVLLVEPKSNAIELFSPYIVRYSYAIMYLLKGD